MKTKKKTKNKADLTVRNAKHYNKEFAEIKKRLSLIEDWITKVIEASNNTQVKAFEWKPDKKRAALLIKQLKKNPESLYQFHMRLSK